MKRDTRKVHANVDGRARCGAWSSRPVLLRKRRDLITCVSCLAALDVEAGHPWLVFYGTQCALAWGRSKKAATAQFRAEWETQHRGFVPPTAREIRVRRLNLEDEWWLLAQVDGRPKANEWHRALDVLKTRAERNAA